ncbi:MAG: YiiX/YebB-like N1pC/P60 family cysteine hydrolase [Pseudomonadota bacterium]
MINWIRNAVVGWLKHKRPLPSLPLSDFERIRHEVKPCDVILVEGRSRVSEVIKLITQSSWSHAALYIGRLHDIEDPLLQDTLRKHYLGPADHQLIVESEIGLGTVVRPLTVYEAEHLRICRPRNLGYTDSQAVIAYAISRLGTTYNVRQIFDLARFLFPWFIMPRRWRSTLFSARPGESTQTVCSTMIAEAFGAIEFPILPLVKQVEDDEVRLYMRNPKLCTPSDFDYSPYFDIIKYPFLDFHHYMEQRLIPWGDAEELSAAERDIYVAATAKGDAR